MKKLRQWMLRSFIVCVVTLTVLGALSAPCVCADELSNIDRGMILDRIRSHLWFRDANTKGFSSGLDDLSAVYGLDILNNLNVDGLRQTLEAENWFRRSENKGPQDIKSLLQEMR
ncbi:MAG: hypothetical protein ACP5M0_12480 [Desulfomonilaceae bacterium]